MITTPGPDADDPRQRMRHLEHLNAKLSDRVTQLEDDLKELDSAFEGLKQWLQRNTEKLERVATRLQAEDDRRRRATEMSMRNVT